MEDINEFLSGIIAQKCQYLIIFSLGISWKQLVCCYDFVTRCCLFFSAVFDYWKRVLSLSLSSRCVCISASARADGNTCTFLNCITSMLNLSKWGGVQKFCLNSVSLQNFHSFIRLRFISKQHTQSIAATFDFVCESMKCSLSHFIVILYEFDWTQLSH